MKKFKQVVRLVVLTLLILLACTGVGIVGGFPLKNREQYLDKETTIELVEKKEDESEDEEEKA